MKIAQFNRFTIEMPQECVDACSHSGACDLDVNFWVNKVNINVDPNLIRAELKEYGAWNENELKNDIENKKRILWIAAGNIRDEIDKKD